MNKFEEKTIQTEMIFEGKVVKLQVDDIELPDGKKAKREIIKHPGAVAILALTNEGRIVLVEQYRKALERSIIEIPAGKLEKGEGPEATARRELEEETGYVCQSMKLLQSFYTSPGFADELVYLYLAEGLTQKEERLMPDEDEFVELMEVTLEEAEKMIKDQRIHDAKTAYAIQYLQLQKALTE
ncbi:NUDIX hydrolase [Bacillus thermotolerans]|uniref:ADP-ribose pyrophosphatase n=1 Tax=Bacillus thermotolerans TaxID=1221996 RepID=A0A0F5HZS2_BACTR|nr:NUDIX hydrolase [Bacillus thermotolerans]KKB36431.1 ADP-ribose pyrophosphatase [Bacillus thermotolerans]KKB37903.1 ADP-ribose pyrophosphatase [Bacillus thermotolerans]KKB38387.1 ADP-ribose pyrophosphatase [Bacillus thermotolerans]